MVRPAPPPPATRPADAGATDRPRARLRPRRGFLGSVALALAVAAGAATAETAPASPVPGHLLGLVDLAMLSADDPVPGDGALAPLRALAAPSPTPLLSVPATGIGAVLAVPGPSAVVTAPSGPGTVGALVFGVAGPATDPWYLLAHLDGKAVAGYGWYRAAPHERLVRYERLLIDGLAYMRNGWDGMLHSTPIDPVAHRVIPPSGGGAIRVVDAWMDDDDAAASWLLIVVFVEDSVCGEDWPVVVASGWVRAYRDDSGPAAWFHADGC